MKHTLNKTKIRASIVGSSGYSGLELLKLLNNHKYVELKIATSNTYGGKNVSDIFPSFNSNNKNGKAGSLSFVPLNELRKVSFYTSDIVFLCLPAFESMEFVNKYLPDFKGVIIDIGSDFRIKDEKDFELWYGKPHTDKKLLKKFVYGLPEIYGEKIKASRYIANPGCYPTSVILAMAPLLSCKDLEVTNINIDSKSGVSGAGRKLKNDYMFCSINENFFAYSPLMHRHTGEIEQELTGISGKNVRVCFTPHLLPINRGIFTSIYCKVEICAEKNKTGGANVNPRTITCLSRENNSGNVHGPDFCKQLNEMIFGLYRAFYSDSAFVKFLGEKIPQLKDVAGTNFCQIGIALDERTGTLKIFSTIDNLLKGAAGQAVQNMNLIFNLDQKEGLIGYGIFS
jgi:N-acetyl-gamma-glutamyl-phosphate reductase